MIFVNFKTYKEGTGARAIKLAEICQEVQSAIRQMAERTKVKIIPVVQAVDLWRIKDKFPELEVWVQHVDWQPQGQYTGFTNLEAVIEAGAKGTLLNHSEHPLPPGTVNQVIKRIRNKELGSRGFKVMVGCKTIGQAKRLVKLGPDFLAYEPPELIGSQEKSVASEKPKVIKKIVSLASPIPVVVGAGIHCPDDVKISLKMGAKGVLVATDVVLAKDQKRELSDLVKGFAR